MKKVLKIIGKIILGIIIFVLIFYVAFVANELRKSYQWQKSVDNFEQAMREPYEKDIYGGSTPEQTWELFLTALRNEDIELASKYFAVEKQEKIKRLLKNEIANNNLQVLIDIYSQPLHLESTPMPTKAYYYILKKDQGETSKDSIVFYLNPLTKVWKILVL